MKFPNGQSLSLDLDGGFDISIPLRFNGPQPNAYGVEPATSAACESGDLVGDTRRGGSCNFERYSFVPHCSGTHTECVGHITNERISLRDCLLDVFVSATLVSVVPVAAAASGETYSVPYGDSDRLITRSVLGAAARSTEVDSALIVRTMPNDEGKLMRRYGDTISPYFTTEAMQFIVECGYKHLLVDIPSIDRLFDQGKLSNHRAFWNVSPGSFETDSGTRVHSTITELVYVPQRIDDGEYLLNLQIAPFASDASPSRPVIFKRT